jgi:cellulose synthase (UDP-forming)
MSPRLVLQLWRERWGKADEGVAHKTYVGGKVYMWLKKLPYSPIWAKAGISWLVIFFGLMFIGLTSHINFPVNGQISFALLLIAIALYIRRLQGPVVTLLLAGLSVMSASHYFAWRLGQTIVDENGSAFLWAFALGSAEVSVAFYFIVGWMLHLWPIQEHELVIDLEDDEHATIDLLLICSNVDAVNAIEQLRATTELNWPKQKIQVSVIDSLQRIDVKLVADSLGMSSTSTLAEAVASGQGEFIVFVDGELQLQNHIQKDFLKQTIGWFIRDVSLAFMSDDQHFLSSPTCEQTQKNYMPKIGGRAILRRSELPVDLNSPSSTNSDLRNKLQNRSALLVEIAATNAGDHGKFLRIDRANSAAIIASKQRLVDLHQMLHFYAPAAILLFFTAPLANLIGGIRLLHAPIDLWAAMFLPFAILFAITESRCHSHFRLGTWKELRDVALSAYFLFVTSHSFVKTKFKDPFVAFTRFRSEQSTGHVIRDVAVYGLFWLNVFGLLCGASLIVSGRAKQLDWLLFFCAWALLNMGLLLAKKAIDHEANEVKSFARRQGRLKGAIRLPFGRTAVCETLNFPDHELALKTPSSVALKVNDEIQMTLFHHNFAFTLPVRVKRSDGLNCTVQVTDQALPEFEKVKDVVFARAPNWPLWLPNKNADKPFPAWVYRLLNTIPVKSIDLMTKFASFLRWDALVQLWKK